MESHRFSIELWETSPFIDLYSFYSSKILKSNIKFNISIYLLIKHREFNIFKLYLLFT